MHMQRLPDGDHLEDDLERIRLLYPSAWNQILQQEPGYVLLEQIGDTLRVVKHYVRSAFPRDLVRMLENNQILLEMPEDGSSGPAISLIAGETRWRMQEVAKYHGHTREKLLPSGLVLVSEEDGVVETESQIRPEVEKWEGIDER